MAELNIIEEEFWAWAKEKGLSVDEIKRRWGNGFSQKINEVNWQVKKMTEAEDKIWRIINSDEVGKLLGAYLKHKNMAEIEKMRGVDE